jgi:hypothetical protein
MGRTTLPNLSGSCAAPPPSLDAEAELKKPGSTNFAAAL